MDNIFKIVIFYNVCCCIGKVFTLPVLSLAGIMSDKKVLCQISITLYGKSTVLDTVDAGWPVIWAHLRALPRARWRLDTALES